MIQYLHGHAIHVLQGLAANSVNAIITSPPYHKLKSYGTVPQVWPVVGKPLCVYDHAWENEEILRLRGKVGDKSSLEGGEQERHGGRLREVNQGQFCQMCGAWRGELGQEPTIALFIEHLVSIFAEVRRVLHPSGVCIVNMGDTYQAERGYQVDGGKQIAGSQPKHGARLTDGLKRKDLCMIPARLAMALQDDGWWLRSFYPWVKRNGMPGSYTDRPVTAHEFVLLLTKSEHYFYDHDAVRVPYSYMVMGGGRSQRTSDYFFDSLRYILEGGETLLHNEEGDPLALVVNPKGTSVPHYATYPEKLVELLVKVSTSEKGVCPQCLAPWERVVEKEFVPQGDVSLERGVMGAPGQKPFAPGGSGWDGVQRGSNIVRTVGWQPTCNCNAGNPVPAIVLDPFVGTGTTCREAAKLRRKSIGIDLQGEYLDIAKSEPVQIGLI